MALTDLQRARQIKSLNLTREQIAIRALAICDHAITVGSYTNAVAAIGRMQTLAMAIQDDYWKEKRMIGKDKEYFELLEGKEVIIRETE